MFSTSADLGLLGKYYDISDTTTLLKEKLESYKLRVKKATRAFDVNCYNTYQFFAQKILFFWNKLYSSYSTDFIIGLIGLTAIIMALSALWIPLVIMAQILLLSRIMLWAAFQFIEASFAFCHVYQILRPGVTLRSSNCFKEDQIKISVFAQMCLEPLSFIKDIHTPDALIEAFFATELITSLEKDMIYLKEYDSQEALFKKGREFLPGFSEDLLKDVMAPIWSELQNKKDKIQSFVKEKMLKALETDLAAVQSWKMFIKKFPTWNAFYSFYSLYNRCCALLEEDTRISFKSYFISRILDMPFNDKLYEYSHLYDIADSLDYFKNFFVSECVQNDKNLSRQTEETFYEDNIHPYLVGDLIQKHERDDHGYWTKELFETLEILRQAHQKKKQEDSGTILFNIPSEIQNAPLIPISKKTQYDQ